MRGGRLPSAAGRACSASRSSAARSRAARGRRAAPTIARVDIEGNLRVEEDAIRVHLQIAARAAASTRTPLDKDVRAIYAHGLLRPGRRRRRRRTGRGRRSLVFRVHERPLVARRQDRGHRRRSKTEEVEAALQVRAAHHPRPREDAPGHRGGEEALRREGLPRRRPSPTRPTPVGENEVDVTYTVEEGDARPHRGDRLRGQRGLQRPQAARRHADARRSGSSRFITGAGVLNQDVLQDRRRAPDRLLLRQRLRHRARRRAARRAPRRRPLRHRSRSTRASSSTSARSTFAGRRAADDRRRCARTSTTQAGRDLRARARCARTSRS